MADTIEGLNLNSNLNLSSSELLSPVRKNTQSNVSALNLDPINATSAEQQVGTVSATPIATKTATGIEEEKKESSLDMQNELAQIQALSNVSNASGGLGTAIGTGVGTGGGAIVGSLIPVVGTGIGAVAGGAVGGAIGSVVDFMIDSNAKDRIARKQADLKRKLIKKQQRKSNAKGIAERKARLKGIGLSLEEEALTADQAIKNERKNTLSNVMFDIGQKNAFKNQLNTSFKAQRGLV
jgi:hypothetical protein